MEAPAETRRTTAGDYRAEIYFPSRLFGSTGGVWNLSLPIQQKQSDLLRAPISCLGPGRPQGLGKFEQAAQIQFQIAGVCFDVTGPPGGKLVSFGLWRNSSLRPLLRGEEEIFRIIIGPTKRPKVSRGKEEACR